MYFLSSLPMNAQRHKMLQCILYSSACYNAALSQDSFVYVIQAITIMTIQTVFISQNYFIYFIQN